MISVGDKITSIHNCREHNAVVCSATVEVVETGFADTFRWSMPWQYHDAVRELVSIADEGQEWIRGWHDRDSPEVSALLSAYALTRAA